MISQTTHLRLLSFVDEERLRTGAALALSLYSSPTLTWAQSYTVLDRLQESEAVEVSFLKSGANSVTDLLLDKLEIIGWSMEETTDSTA